MMRTTAHVAQLLLLLLVAFAAATSLVDESIQVSQSGGAIHQWRDALRNLMGQIVHDIWSTRSADEPAREVQVERKSRLTEPKSSKSPTVHVLLYETESVTENSHAQSLMQQLSHFPGVQASIFGQGTAFEGFGSKYAAVYPILQTLSPHDLVVLSDSRDVLINSPVATETRSSAAALVHDFRQHYAHLTRHHPHAIVLSAEAQCCVSALTHVMPGDYYHADGSRNERSCASGEEDCEWVSDESAAPWQEWMQALASSSSSTSTTHHHNHHGHADVDDVYLNAGLMVGTVENLRRVIEQAQIGKDEDDQAVLTDFMHWNPNSIVLDYGQTLFGNNRGGLGGMDAGSCVFDMNQSNRHASHTKPSRLVHTKTMTTPMFLHSPGGFYACQEELSRKLGLITAEAASRTHRRLTKKDDPKCNYGGNYKCRRDLSSGEPYDVEGHKRLLRGEMQTMIQNVRGNVEHSLGDN
jgi:hypothetical protein